MQSKHIASICHRHHPPQPAPRHFLLLPLPQLSPKLPARRHPRPAAGHRGNPPVLVGHGPLAPRPSRGRGLGELYKSCRPHSHPPKRHRSFSNLEDLREDEEDKMGAQDRLLKYPSAFDLQSYHLSRVMADAGVARSKLNEFMDAIKKGREGPGRGPTPSAP